MKIQLIHPFRFDLRADWIKILDSVDTLQKFENRIKRFCDADTDHLDDDERGQKVRTFLGDAFEVFVEMLIKSHPFDRRIGVSHYKPCHPNFGNADHGVDGAGIGTNGNPATVQSKFRGDPTSELTANGAHLVNFKNSSHEEFGVLMADTDNMLVITNCKGIHHYTASAMLNNKVRCIGRNHLKQMVDDNIPFWNEFRRATQPVLVPSSVTI
jgi:hypothetical protein